MEASGVAGTWEDGHRRVQGLQAPTWQTLRKQRVEGRKVFSVFTLKADGELGVWLSGICVLVFARPWLRSLGL